MKKNFIVLSAILLFASNNVFADSFDNLSNLTTAQKEQLTQIHDAYKQENNAIETKIMEFNSKIAKIQKETDKSASDISVLTSAYQRNVDSLKAKQQKLAKQLDEDYKAVLSEEQYRQYELQKGFVDTAFNNFLQK